MPVFSLPGTFVDDVDVPLSAADLNQLRDVAVLLDGLTFRRTSACCSSGAQTHGDAANWHTRGDYRQSWWGGIYRSGATTLTFEGVCDYQLDFYHNGALMGSQVAAPGGFTKNLTLTGLADGDALTVEVRTNGNPTTVAGYSSLFRIDDVYMSPVVVASAWPGVPSFAGTYNAARLNQLLDAAQYVWDRVSAVPLIPVLGGFMARSTHRQETIRLFDGSVGRYASNEVLRVYGTLNCRVNAEHYEIDYGGTTYTSPTYTAGQNIAIAHAFALTNTLGTRAKVAIRAVNEDSTYAALPSVYSSYTFQAIRSEADAAGYATQTPPTAWVANTNMTDTTLNSKLNSLATMLSTAKSRLDARPELWNRLRLMRRVYAKDDTQVERNKRMYAASFVRQGDRLVVRGKGVKVAYGAISFKPPEKEGEPINYQDFTWAVEQNVGAQEDKIETSIVYLDALDGLELGMRYFVFSAGALEVGLEYLV
jgi:hypothetical protein